MACDEMRDGRQTVLIRKGGIREENGVFEMTDREFFLLPTYEHQKSSLLKPDAVKKLEQIQAVSRNPNEIAIDSYVVVEEILTCISEDKINSIADEFPWNEEYVKMRFDFNPYDPLYVLLLRVYRLPKAVTLPAIKDYDGCKSWVTLERNISLEGMKPVLSDREHVARSEKIRKLLNWKQHASIDDGLLKSDSMPL